MSRSVYLALPLLLLQGLASAATLDAGGWFASMGSFQGCMTDPGEECPEAKLGMSSLDRALAGDGSSSLLLRQASGQKWNFAGGRAVRSRADMDLGIWMTTPMRSAVGLALYSPWPAGDWTRGADSVRMIDSPAATHVGVRLGWDLLSFQEDRSRQLLLDAELPVYYGPGRWHAGLAWYPSADWRVRVEYEQVTPREEIEAWDDEDLVFKMKYTERRGQVQLAGRMAYGPEWSVAARHSVVEAKRTASTFTYDGRITGGSAGVAWIERNWSWKAMADAEYRDLDPAWYDGTGAQQLDGRLTYDIYRFHSRLQRDFADFLTVGLVGERRLVNGNARAVVGNTADTSSWLNWVDFSDRDPQPLRTQTSLYGGDVRLWAHGLFFELGGDYALQRRHGSTSPLETWGASIAQESLGPSEYAVARGGVGFQAEKTLYQYSYRQAFALGDNGAVRYGGHHQFSIVGGF